MTPSEQKRYETYFDLFASDGWKQFTEELKEDYLRVNNLGNIKDAKELHFRQGQLSMMQGILNMESMTKMAYEEATDDEAV